jgi:DNA polymerase II small subunit
VGSSLRTAYETIISAGYQVSPEAFAALEVSKSPEAVVRRLLDEVEAMSNKPLIIERSHLEHLAVLPPKTLVQTCVPAQIKVIRGAESFHIEGTISDFKSHFTDRFDKLQHLLKSRGDLKDATTASCIPEGNKWRKVKVIGMVMSKRDSKSGVTSVVLEDKEGSVDVVFRSKMKEKVARLLMDEVVCIAGFTKNARTVMAEDIIWPDLAPRVRSTAPREDAYVVMTSDIHIGSKLFMQESFESFINWICGEGDEGASKQIALKTRYLLIAGDLVDGVGIYPNQEEELSIKDLYKQYDQVAEYLARVPPGIKIIIIPGNHDACRPTLPTPPIYREYAGPLYSLKNVTMLGDPSVVVLDGFTFLLTHGRSLDDAIPSLPNCSFKEPQKAMVELLRSRHLSPTYGEKTPLAPEHCDSLIIDPVPDVFQAGHVHVLGVTEYRGVVVANTGTWQAQTKYQLSMGIEPQPGLVPVLNLANFKVTTLKFT